MSLRGEGSLTGMLDPVAHLTLATADLTERVPVDLAVAG
jgi:hypothetical protein